MNIREQITKLEEENRQREEQVKSWGEQREQLMAAIQKTKEDHDYCRGQISALKAILAEEEKGIEQADAAPAERPSLKLEPSPTNELV